jgi:hypothetical protein
VEGWLELDGAVVKLRSRTPASNHCKIASSRGSGRCAMSKGDGWEKKGCSRSPAAANSAGGACRCAEVRRRISLRLVEVFERDQREMREEGLGYL